MARPNPKNSFSMGQDPGMWQFGMPDNAGDTLLDDEEKKKKLLQQRSPAASVLFGQNVLGDAASQLFPSGNVFGGQQ